MPATQLLTRSQVRESLQILQAGWNTRKLIAAIEKEANDLAEAMRLRVHVKHGELRDSIRVESGKSPFVLWVKAGGSGTTTPGGYDYAMATEFGTRKEHARPFFWNTYRARARAIKERLDAVIRESIAELNQGDVVMAHGTLEQRAAAAGIAPRRLSGGAAIGKALGDF
jgi:HK97 gp10 family phage protein